MTAKDMDHLVYLNDISQKDVEQLMEKEKTYGGSWKQRGGVGAFMMLARKWDRMENKARKNGYDIFQVIKNEEGHRGDGTMLAEIRDLRTYLLLVESEMVARGYTDLEPLKMHSIGKPVRRDSYVPGTPEDGGHHERSMADLMHDEQGPAQIG